MTRLTLPKDGKFGVVVLGSAGSAMYPESVSALSGKVVYTVYLKMGLRKSWILQYCLVKSPAESAANKGTAATPLDAPWPFLMMRPDQWSASDPDYIVIHGMVTSAGQFEQLAMVFPEQLDERDLLLRSLKLWAFRPAARDGEPVAVEGSADHSARSGISSAINSFTSATWRTLRKPFGNRPMLIPLVPFSVS